VYICWRSCDGLKAGVGEKEVMDLLSSFPYFAFTVSTAAKILASSETSSSRTSMADLTPSLFSSSMASTPACGERLPRR